MHAKRKTDPALTASATKKLAAVKVITDADPVCALLARYSISYSSSCVFNKENWVVGESTD